MTHHDRPIRGIKDEEALNPKLIRREIKTWEERAGEILKDRNWAILLFIVGPAIMLSIKSFWLFGFLWSMTVYFCHKSLTKYDALPIRLPVNAKRTDYNSPKPGGKKFNRAEGIFYIGNARDSKQEIWLDQNDILTHMLLFGTTGAGKTEALLSLSYNVLAMGSGMIYVDPKGTARLAHQILNMCRALGREDDFLALNFGVQEKDESHKLSNTCNPFSFGTAEILTEMLSALMPAGDAKNQVFQAKGQTIISALMYALVDLRDKGKLVISPRVIRDHLNADKFIELSENKNLSDFTRESLLAALSTCNFTKNMALAKQKSFHEQFGYGKAYFGQTLSSLADTYGHIFDVEAGEIDFRDIIQNRRVLVVLIPAIEKSPVEMSNLGKIVLSCLKAAAATGLGMRLEGSAEEVLGRLPTNFQGIGPFLTIVDEYAAITTPGFEILLTQGRGLGMATIVASQDYAGLVEADKKGTQQIVGNTNTKSFMKVEDPETYELIRKLTGTANLVTMEGWNFEDQYKDNFKAAAEKMNRVDFQDLMEQTQGETHIVWRGKLIRADMFHANPDLEMDFRTHRKIQMEPLN